MDGANMNAIAGWVDLMLLESMLFTITHKLGQSSWRGWTKDTVAVSHRLVDFLPGVVEKEEGAFKTKTKTF